MKKQQSNRNFHTYLLLMTNTQPINLTQATSIHSFMRKDAQGGSDDEHRQKDEKSKEVRTSNEKTTIKQKFPYVPPAYDKYAANKPNSSHLHS
jgi:hypothetical protein